MNNKKIKVYLDFDSTIVDSIERFVDLANIKFNVNKYASDIGDFCFRNLYPNITKEEIYEIFGMKEFFNDSLKPIENAMEVIFKYKDDFDFYLSTASSGENLMLKKEWVNKNMPFLKGMCVSSGTDKSNTDMRRAIQIDDVYECLESTNSKIKILFKNNKNYKWQRHSNDLVYDVNNWDEIDKMLMYYLKEGIN